MWRVIVSLMLAGIVFSSLPLSAEEVYEAWVATYNGPGNDWDKPVALLVDDSGYVYVFGRSVGEDGFQDFVTIKYSPAGETLWVRRYNVGINSQEEPWDMTLDNAGNILVTGSSWVNYDNIYQPSDYITIKYSSTGDFLWTARYNGPVDASDEAFALATDVSGNVYVSGRSVAPGIYRDFLTIKYSASGDTIWTRRYSMPSSLDIYVIDMEVDSEGNLLLTGGTKDSLSDYDMITFKYSNAGELIWLSKFKGTADKADKAWDLGLDGSNNAFITGYTTGESSNRDYVTVKYSPLGEALWARTFNGTANLLDQSWALAVNDSGNVYITGYSSKGETEGVEIVTIRYSADGDTDWIRSYGSSGETYTAWDVQLDEQGYVYVGGDALLKYSPVGDLIAKREHRGFHGQKVRVDLDGNIYVVGNSEGIGTRYDITTVKYSQCNPSSPKAGDANADGKYTLSDVLSAFNYMFYTPGCSPLPSCWLSERLCRGDWNGDGKISIVDVVWGVNFIFNKPIGGPWNPKTSVGCCP